jgi:hypothetical protein
MRIEKEVTRTRSRIPGTVVVDLVPASAGEFLTGGIPVLWHIARVATAGEEALVGVSIGFGVIVGDFFILLTSPVFLPIMGREVYGRMLNDFNEEGFRAAGEMFHHARDRISQLGMWPPSVQNGRD